MPMLRADVLYGLLYLLTDRPIIKFLAISLQRTPIPIVWWGFSYNSYIQYTDRK